MTADTAEKILNKLDLFHALLFGKKDVWVPKKLLMEMTGWSSSSINTLVSRGEILKKKGKDAYSYNSYHEHAGIHKTRKRKMS